MSGLKGGGAGEFRLDLGERGGADGAEGGGVFDSGARLEDFFGVGVEFLEAVAEAGRGESDALGEDVAGLGGEGGEVGGPVALEGGFGDTVLRGDIAEGSGEEGEVDGFAVRVGADGAGGLVAWGGLR